MFVTGFHVSCQTNEMPKWRIAGQAPSMTFQMMSAMTTSATTAAAPQSARSPMSPIRSPRCRVRRRTEGCGRAPASTAPAFQPRPVAREACHHSVTFRSHAVHPDRRSGRRHSFTVHVVEPTRTVAQVGVAKPPPAPERRETVFDVQGLDVFYGAAPAIKGASLEVYKNSITALIGPSGCGKSTFLRCLNRMNDLVPSARVEGKLLFHGIDLYGPEVDPIEVRRRIGMVFQRPNPFPKSIYDNVAYGLRILGMKDNLDDRVKHALERAAIWDEVKHRLRRSALGLSGGQQQRLCIARAIAVEPDVILLDEPASALDPISTSAIEDLMHELKRDYTLVIVTHNMQQAARVAE